MHGDCAVSKGLVLLLLLLLASASEPAAADAPLEGAPDAIHYVGLERDLSLTLSDLVRRTAEQEPGAGVVAAQRDEAAALARDAGRWLPGAPALMAGYVDDRAWDDDGYREWDAGVELPLWWPGQRRGRRASAEAAEAEARLAGQAHLLEVAGWVRQTVAGIAIAQLRLEIAKAEWEAEQALVAQVARAVELQELAERDLVLAQSASLERRLQYLAALEETRHAETQYALLTGLARWPARWQERPHASSSLAQHPSLQLAAEEVARAEGEILRISRESWGHPIVALGTQHEREARGEDFSDRLMAGVRIPLGRRKGADAETAAARRVLAEARRDAGRLERELRGRAEHARRRLQLAGERVSTTGDQAEMAAEYLRLIERGFALGETDLATLLRARARATTGEQARREALIWRDASAAQLNQALGVVP